MLKFGLFTALLVTAAAVQAQPATTPPPSVTATTPVPPPAPAQPQQQVTPPPAFIQAATALGQCLQGAAGQVPATTSPEAGATQVLAACTTQQTTLETQFEAWVASDAFPAEGRDMARQQFRAQLGQAEAQVANAIRQQRAAPVAPAPTPSN